MASTISACLQHRRAPHVCSIVPSKILQTILDTNETSDESKASAQKTLNHVHRLHAVRQQRVTLAHPTASHTLAGESDNDDDIDNAPAPHSRAPPRRSIVPPKIFQAMAESEDSTSDQKYRAGHNLQHIEKISISRADHSTKAKPTTAVAVNRALYTSAKTDKLEKKLLFKEGATVATMKIDSSAGEVYTYFGDTWTFYNKVFSRNSIDDKGLHLVGSVHYDDEPGEPGMDNAFWDGQEMAFGDGDGEIFGSFTKNIDVIGHELTHGVTQHTAELEYEYESGALNESISDVFGSMIKQYFFPGGQQTAEDADWLIGEGIFLPTMENSPALRSMKAPGTAYDNPKIGKDDQPATMDGYVTLPNTASGDSGGVHTNSGIPNHAFYLAATYIGGYSWEKAGKIWYASLLDTSLHGIDTKKAFVIFANLTVKYAKSLFDQDTADKVTKAWNDVKVLAASEPAGDEKGDL